MSLPVYQLLINSPQGEWEGYVELLIDFDELPGTQELSYLVYNYQILLPPYLSCN